MIRIQNLYYMLSYAFQVLKEEGYKKITTEEFANVADLCAGILIKGVSYQIKRGLGKEYIQRNEELSCLTGKVDITSSIKSQTMLNKRLFCNYDEFSVNSYMNRILKTTMEILCHGKVSKERKKKLRKLLVYFSTVENIDVKMIDWHLRFNRNNQEYRMLISVCYLVIKGLLQTKSDGNIELMDFIDEQRMARLYEKFILEYYKQEHPELKVSSSQIPWNLDDGYSEMLPVMQSDIMLEKDHKILVIDAKYYQNTLQAYHDVYKNHSSNLYQIYTYVKNLDKEHSGNVSGLLLYAKTDNVILPDNHYKMSGNSISVETLDLDCDFFEIRKQLDFIANKFIQS